MQADADFHLVIADLERRSALGRGGAGGQAEAHAAHIRVHAVGKLNELIEALALFRCGADDLIAENRARNAAAARGERAVLDCHVVVSNHDLGVDVVHLAHFAGHTELAAVTRVVLDHEQNAGAGIDGLGGLIDGVSRRSAGERERAQALHARLTAQSDAGIGRMGVRGVKLDMQLRGLSGGHVRCPLHDATQDERDLVAQLFAQYGISRHLEAL